MYLTVKWSIRETCLYTGQLSKAMIILTKSYIENKTYVEKHNQADQKKSTVYYLNMIPFQRNI